MFPVVEPHEPIRLELFADVCEQVGGQDVKMKGETAYQPNTTGQQCEADFVVTATAFKDGVTIFYGIREMAGELSPCKYLPECSQTPCATCPAALPGCKG